MTQLTIQQTFALALQHHQAGRLREAEELYRQIIAQQPGHFDAVHLLGVVAHQAGRNDLAVDLIRRAIAFHPNFPEAYSNLGIALKENGQLDEAIAAYQQAVAMRPDYAGAYSNLGIALESKRQLDEAIAAYRQAIALNPNFPEALSNLGNALQEKGMIDEAISAHRKAIALNPNYVEAHNNLGNALKYLEQIDEAIIAYQQAIAHNPNYAEAHNNLGDALKDNGQLDEAIAAFHRAIALKPNLSQAHNNLGNALKDKSELDNAIAAYRRAVALSPNDAQAHSNLVLALHYPFTYKAEAIAAEHRRWNDQHAAPLRKLIGTHSNDSSPDRRLRIGYVSADFREHPVGRFILPILAHHDHRTVEIFCYSQVSMLDGITESLRSHADHWRGIVGWSDDQVAAQIRADAIDILIDLSGHTSGNRLLVFARKPAPVQVSYLGYPGTTGLSAIDYRLTDCFADPPGLTDHLHTEKLHRLPQSNWCFAATEDSPPVQPSPAFDRGYVTFGSFNNFAKMNDAMLEAWGKILREVPGSRLLLKAAAFGAASVCERVRRNLAAQDIGVSRLDLRGRLPNLTAHLKLYDEMDIALDTFPYNGTTTTCDALWMGVPVITLAGQTHASRVGLSLLSNIGMPEMVATTMEEYIRLAVALAMDQDRLKLLRIGLRERMRKSPLMDAEGFARDLERTYRQMWKAWCERSL